MICRWILIVVVLFSALFVGCVTASNEDFRPLGSAAIAVHSQSSLPPTPPKPAPGGKCDACKGTGRVGDGRVSVPCQKCGGDGVL
jgi:hypothetical protein